MKKRTKRRTRAETEAARERVLAAARRRKGRYINCDGARAAGGWNKAWYHLRVLCKRGLMVHANEDRWELTRRAG